MIFKSLIKIKIQFNNNLLFKRCLSNKIKSIHFYGTDDFSLKSFEALLQLKEENQNLSLKVITPEDKLTGRGLTKLKPTIIKQISELNKIPYYHPPNTKKLNDWVPYPNEGYLADLAIVVSFGYFLPKNLLSKYQFGGINVHPSLLPKYRGPAPIIHTLLNGDKETGVTIQELSIEKFDAGKILLQEKMEISPFIEYNELHNQLSLLGSKLLIQVLNNWDYYQLNKFQQNEQLVTQAPKLTKNSSLIDPKFHTLNDILRINKALGQRFPIHLKFNNQIVRLRQLQKYTLTIEEKKLSNLTPGQFYFLKDKNIILLCLKDLEFIQINELQLENKKWMNAKDFFNGYQQFINLI